MNNPDHILQVVPGPKQIMYKKVTSFGRKDTKFVSTTVLKFFWYVLLAGYIYVTSMRWSLEGILMQG
jgi:hypothetical protein